MLKETKQKRILKEVESNFVKFDEIGQSIEGEIVNINEELEEFDIYTIRDDDGILRKFHDSTQLRDLLKSAEVSIGTYIRVTYIEDKKLPNGTLKIFRLEKE